MGKRYTRQQFLGVAGTGAAGVAILGLAGCGSEKGTKAGAQSGGAQDGGATSARQAGVQSFRSRPDLRPPVIEVNKPASGTADGYVFVAAKNGGTEEHPSQDGPMILDNEGQPLWLYPLSKEKEDVMSFRKQYYQGEPVLTWWQGVHAGWGKGSYKIFDSSYQQIALVRAGNGYLGDHHEFLITDRDTALIDIFGEVPMDTSSLGGRKDAVVMEGVFQEIDIETGEVLFEWHSLDHVGLEASYYDPAADGGAVFDYFHINSIDVANDGNFLVSSRKTSTVYKVDRNTGDVIWRLGGKHSDFEMGKGARFAFQHDARSHPDGTITLFDNRGQDMHEPSRGLVLDLDETKMKATLVREYIHPDKIFGIFQGDVQTLPNGNVFIGWGSAPYFSEFSHDGKLLYDASFPKQVESYRSYRFPWTGSPDEDPAIAVEPGQGDEVKVYASYNGATELAEWEVLAGPDADRARPVGSAPRDGFETVITVQTGDPYLKVRAKDRSGKVLGSVEA